MVFIFSQIIIWKEYYYLIIIFNYFLISTTESNSVVRGTSHCFINSLRYCQLDK